MRMGLIRGSLSLLAMTGEAAPLLPMTVRPGH
jgi:hypothetical protein